MHIASRQQSIDQNHSGKCCKELKEYDNFRLKKISLFLGLTD